MKKILEFIEWNFLPAIMCMAIVIAFKAPTIPLTASDIVIGVLLVGIGLFTSRKITLD